MKRQINQLPFTASLALGAVLLSLAISNLAIAPAQAQVLQSGTLIITQTCPATRAINGPNPGNIQVAQNQRYQVIGFNSAERRFVLIKVPNANPERRWVSANCGTFQAGSAANGNTPNSNAPNGSTSETRTRPSNPSSTALLPFFDQSNNLEVHRFPAGRPADITPPAPSLTAFDQAVLQTCGPIGSTVNANRFKQLMANHPEVLRQIQTAVGGELLPGRNTQAEFLDDLTAAWSDRGGFEHIFCGELEGPQKIGGLHFVGRYLQLQNEKIGGRLGNNLNREEVEPGVLYTLGVVVKRGNQTWTDTIKGYPLISDAQEMLLDATKAFKARGNAQGACLYQVQDQPTGKSYQAVFVKDRNAIVTFYPDATPSGRPCRS
ncbi:EndoU domain-containing protein [Trichocoleus sp. FACHB-262]|uniref:EndoU domain-containing protein n=1 Tax=Trichocoleus sp. FACHB-262 TaxID=2692869 RepID=UPI001688BDF4|nr:EndoU domain-containing protein [Trichocoleus sp. FACHB-262]MBD2119972.1 EndoU domain-containing protein [Trichocoleus sp. FACHB-262]